jgi:hypothetical protein
MNGIDPKYVFWLGILVTIETAIGQGTVQLTNLVDAHWIPTITGWCTLLSFVGNVVMTGLAGYSSKTAGPLVKPLVLAAVILGGLFAFTGDARAQGLPKIKPLTGNIVNDLGLAKPPLITGNVEKDLQGLWDKIVASSIADLNYAAAMARSANTQTSGIRLQCINAIIALNQQASGANLKNADGTPMVKPDPHVFTDVESLAEVVDNLSPQGPLFVNCAGAAQLAKTNVLTFVNAVVTGAAGFAAMPIIPGL